MWWRSLLGSPGISWDCQVVLEPLAWWPSHHPPPHAILIRPPAFEKEYSFSMTTSTVWIPFNIRALIIDIYGIRLASLCEELKSTPLVSLVLCLSRRPSAARRMFANSIYFPSINASRDSFSVGDFTEFFSTDDLPPHEWSLKFPTSPPSSWVIQCTQPQRPPIKSLLQWLLELVPLVFSTMFDSAFGLLCLLRCPHKSHWQPLVPF